MRTKGRITDQSGQTLAIGECDWERGGGKVIFWPEDKVDTIEGRSDSLSIVLADATTLSVTGEVLTFSLKDHKSDNGSRFLVHSLRVTEI